jgi:hypothetical protein
MPIDSGYEEGTEPLSVERIHRWVRLAAVTRASEDAGSAGAKLAMVAACIVCLTLGATAREITHWALGDTSFGPFAAHQTRTDPYFRCGGGFAPGRSEEARREPSGWGPSDDAFVLPMPGFRMGPVNQEGGTP